MIGGHSRSRSVQCQRGTVDDNVAVAVMIAMMKMMMMIDESGIGKSGRGDLRGLSERSDGASWFQWFGLVLVMYGCRVFSFVVRFREKFEFDFKFVTGNGRRSFCSE